MAKGETDDGVAQPKSYDFPCWGMTLRDYFAGQALPSCLRTVTEFPDTANPKAVVAKWAYELADAMLDARKR